LEQRAIVFAGLFIAGSPMIFGSMPLAATLSDSGSGMSRRTYNSTSTKHRRLDAKGRGWISRGCRIEYLSRRRMGMA
jgi:hypothetical protein